MDFMMSLKAAIPPPTTSKIVVYTNNFVYLCSVLKNCEAFFGSAGYLKNGLCSDAIMVFFFMSKILTKQKPKTNALAIDCRFIMRPRNGSIT